MKRSSIVFLSVFVCASSANAQHRTATPCPGVTEISNCQVEGCGSGADAELNKAKNIRSPDGTTPTLRTVQWWKELKNPRGADCRNREKLRELGEGEMMRVVALGARRTSGRTRDMQLQTRGTKGYRQSHRPRRSQAEKADTKGE